MYFKKSKYKCQEGEREKAEPAGCLVSPSSDLSGLSIRELQTLGSQGFKSP